MGACDSDLAVHEKGCDAVTTGYLTGEGQVRREEGNGTMMDGSRDQEVDEDQNCRREEEEAVHTGGPVARFALEDNSAVIVGAHVGEDNRRRNQPILFHSAFGMFQLLRAALPPTTVKPSSVSVAPGGRWGINTWQL